MPNTHVEDEERAFSERQRASSVAEIRVSIDDREPKLSHEPPGCRVASLDPPERNTRYTRAIIRDLLFALVRGAVGRRCNLFRLVTQALSFSFFRSVGHVDRNDPLLPPLAQLSLFNRKARVFAS